MIPLREGVLTRAGLDPDTVPFETAELALQRDVQRWLPLALADLVTLVWAYGTKKPPTMPEVLRSWGLLRDADRLEEAGREQRERAEEAAIRRFFQGG